MSKKKWVLAVVVALAIAIISASIAGARIDMPDEESNVPEVKLINSAYLYGTHFVGIVELSEEAAKALEWQVGDLEDWIEGVVYKRAADSMDEMVVRILDDDQDIYLTKAQKEQFSADCAKEGVYLVTLDTMPDSLKANLIKLATP